MIAQSVSGPAPARGDEALLAIATGNTLFHEGDRARRFFRMISGAVRSCRLLPDGRRQIDDFFLSGDFFGFGTGTTYSHSAEAIVGSTLLAYPLAPLDRLISDRPQVTRDLLLMMSRRLTEAQRHMDTVGRKAAGERIAIFLLEMARRCGGEDHVHLPMPRSDIADYLALSRETVSRVMTKFRRRGLIGLPAADEVVIVNRDALAALAEGIEGILGATARERAPRAVSHAGNRCVVDPSQ